jgi:[ribosomal protein S18]-alanine N-acetyltransferase
MNELRSEPARLADLDQLIALDARSFSATDRYRRREWATLLRDSLAGSPTRILVARAPEGVVGAVVIVPELEIEEVNIVSLAVDPSYRRTGLATSLLRDALTQLPAQVRTVSLEVREDNTAARALYEHLGFEKTRRLRRYYADGAAALEYRAPLPEVLARTLPGAQGGS